MEDNKLIAEFMGGVVVTGKTPYENTFWKFPFLNTAPPIATNKVQPESFRYHTSWDWLMPVVKKITETAREWEYETDEKDKFEEIFDIDFVWSDFMNGDLKGIYERVVQFIKWYNGRENQTSNS